MANDYLMSKWKMWFHMLDFSHNGKITLESLDGCLQMFAEFNHLNGDQTERVIKESNKLWDDYILRGNKELNEDAFINMLNEDFKKDKTELRKRMEDFFTIRCKLADTNNEGSINKEEWMATMKAEGHTNLALDEKFFEAFNPEDGKIPIQQMVDSLVQFTTCEDSTIRDIIKEAIEAGF